MLENLRPKYAQAFRCLGSDCEDTCCHGLDVVIDKSAYQKFQNLPDFQPHLQHFVILPNHPNDSQYARIKLTPSCTCPFLSADRMCSIQQEHGEFYLADICASYPRITQRIDGLRETALLMSCPEAARLVLLNPALMPVDDRNLPRYFRFSREAGPAAKANGSPHQYLWDIRAFTLLLLQDRSYPLWQRLFMLGIFCKRLNEITQAQQLGLVPMLLKEHAELIAQGGLRASMNGIPVRSAMQLEAVMEIVNRQLAATDASHVRLRECLQDFLHGIRYQATSPIEHCAPSFEEAHTHYYQPFMQQRPHILENYLLNHVFRTRFPYGVDPQGKLNDPLTEYWAMCVLYSVIKGLLIGIAGHYREAFSEAHVIKLVQSFAKAVEHSPNVLAANYQDLANPDGMALLLKNGDFDEAATAVHPAARSH